MANGVPALWGDVASVTNTAALLVADAQILVGMFYAPQWGIYLNYELAIPSDSVVEVGLKHEWRIPDYLIEQGGFQSYNKVQLPAEIRVTLTCGGSTGYAGRGSDAKRKAFLESIVNAANSTNIYSVMTREGMLDGVSITHCDLRRTAKSGVSLLSVDLWLQEVRKAASPQFTNTAASSGADPQNTGTVQTAAPSSSTPAPSVPAKAPSSLETVQSA